MTLAARLALFLFGAFVLLGAVGAAVTIAGFMSISRDLPDPAMLEHIEFAQQTVVYDRTGEVELARFGEFKREVVTWDELPAVLVDATTAVEDRTFWDNAGFDPVGIASAALDTLRGRSRGASTITQQLVRQRLLTSEGEAQTEVSVERKLREIVQSIRVTQAFPGEEGKRRIMTAYLNQNYYGNDAYGVKSAAEAYFGVPLDQLTLAQAAILAAIPQAPSTYDLVQNAELVCLDDQPPEEGEDCQDAQLVVPADSRIVQRRNLVLDLMEQDRTPLTGDRFTATDFDAARAEPAVLAPQSAPRWKASHFVWQVRRELTRRLCGEDAETCPVLERGGLRITTTLDMRLQGIAEKWVKAATVVPNSKSPRATARRLGLSYEPWMANLRDKDLHNGALIAMDYQTGDIVAYVGSADAEATRATRKFQPRFDVLADGWRQPGSAFKPVVYSTGIETRAITAGTMFMDVVTDFGRGYTPTDADNLERGPVRARDALRFSLNIPAVKALAVVGNDRVQAQAEAMGIQFADGKVDAGLSFALGVEEVHPRDLVRAYGVLADGGRLAEQTTIRMVVDAAGDVLVAEADREQPAQVLSPAAAYVVTDILSGNTDPSQNPFWGQFAIEDGNRRRPATLKTGTNNDARDLNAYGYIAAPNARGRNDREYALVVGAWNGNSDNSLVSSPRDPLFSIQVTTYVWQGFLTEATAGWRIRDFERPGGLHTAEVDPWTGLAASGRRTVTELYVEGTGPDGNVAEAGCGESVLRVTGFDRSHDAWMAASLAWLDRAERGPGVAGGPERTRTSYFYNGAYTPYGRSWGPLTGGACATPSPSPSESPSESPSASPSALPSEAPSASPEPTPEPTAEPTAAPTPTAVPPAVTPAP